MQDFDGTRLSRDAGARRDGRLLARNDARLAAIGLSQSDCPARATLTAVLISPMIVPVVVAAVGIYYAFAAVGLLNSLTGLVLAHTVLGAPIRRRSGHGNAQRL
ncbi:hypothetical protein ILFOPFJJ_06272 [Ensifer psoraleae]|nr:hypothetical protein [Sinorhizobium psoraleae]